VETSTSKRLFIAWLVLVVITVIYLWIDETVDANGALASSTTVTAAAICLALVKFWIIMREFMDVRHAPQGLRRVTNLLVALIAVALLSAYFVGQSTA
jgi:heme/copper-type cytochrome/quinol oxidase subunit 4